MIEAIKARHSVRRFTDRAIEGAALIGLRDAVAKANADSGLNMQLLLNAPEISSGLHAQYGRFSGVRNCIALVGKKGPDLEEKVGYYGERVVLQAQCLGLNTCWMAFSYRGSDVVKVASDEELVLAIAVGYGVDAGQDRTRKPIEMLCTIGGYHPDLGEQLPEWFAAGVRAAALAPTCVHQQAFSFGLESADSKAVSLDFGSGKHCATDGGIAKLHFQLGADTVCTDWKWA